MMRHYKIGDLLRSEYTAHTYAWGLILSVDSDEISVLWTSPGSERWRNTYNKYNHSTALSGLKFFPLVKR